MLNLREAKSRLWLRLYRLSLRSRSENAYRLALVGMFQPVEKLTWRRPNG